MTAALRLSALIVASTLSLYATLWFFQRVSLKALLLQSSLFAFLFTTLALFCGIASATGIYHAWRRRRHPGAAGEALCGFLLMLGFWLFHFLYSLIA